MAQGRRGSQSGNKGRNSKGGGAGALALVILIFATFAVLLSGIYFFVAKSYYKDLYNRNFTDGKYQRVIDTGKAVAGFCNIIIVIGIVAIVLCFGAAIVGDIILPDAAGWISQNIPHYATAIGGFCILTVLILHGLLNCMAKRVAVIYLGTFADLSTRTLYFPYEFNSYSLGDWFNLPKIKKDLVSIASVKMAEITKMTRDRGIKLYVHGSFGSKCLEYSNKQKRDEAMSMIQALSGQKGLVQFEMQ